MIKKLIEVTNFLFKKRLSAKRYLQLGLLLMTTVISVGVFFSDKPVAAGNTPGFGSITLSSVTRTTGNNFVASGTWAPQGDHQTKKYTVEIQDNGVIVGEPISAPTTGNTPDPWTISFSLGSGSHKICAFLKHSVDKGADQNTSDCLTDVSGDVSIIGQKQITTVYPYTSGDLNPGQGWTIFLDTDNNGSLDSGEQSTVTDSSGYYSFTNLAYGTYYVAESGQTGWEPKVSPTNPIILSADNNISTGNNFVNYQIQYSYAWYQGNDWGTCSASCGDGTETQTVYCQRNGETQVDDSYCASAGTKPSNTRACNLGACVTYSWVANGWDGCTVTCGGGTQNQLYICQSSLGSAVDDSFCTDTKPTNSQTCNTGDCPTYHWSFTDWGNCSNQCGNDGARTRTVICQDQTNATVADTLCDAGTKPASSEPCSDYSTCTYNWFESGFGGCNNTCGAGTKTQTVYCRRSDGTQVADSSCTTTKPATSQECSDTSGCTYSWYQSEWTTCSVTCGGGTQTKTVYCQRSDQTQVDDSYCLGETTPKPDASQSCNTQTCPAYTWQVTWGTCTGTCGTGTQTGTLSCLEGGEVVVDNTKCSGQETPSTQRNCELAACPNYNWVTGEWGSCSASCGDGTQTRSVACVSSTSTSTSTQSTVTDENCANSGTKPAASQSCNLGSCGGGGGGGGGTGVVSQDFIITNEAALRISDTSAIISWLTNKPATSRVMYDEVSHPDISLASAPNFGYAFSTTVDETKLVGHSMTITGLKPNTVYYFRPASAASPEKQGLEVSIATTGSVAGEKIYNLDLKQSVGVDFANPGQQQVPSQVTVTNNTSKDALNVLVTVTLPEGAKFTDGTNTKTWTIDELKAGASKTLDYTVNLAKDVTLGSLTFGSKAEASGFTSAQAQAPLTIKTGQVLGQKLVATGFSYVEFLALLMTLGSAWFATRSLKKLYSKIN